MAAGMQAAAAGQLGSGRPDIVARAETEINPLEPIEIAMLSDEKSQEASRILQERSLQSRPMAKYGRMLQCQESTAASRLKKEKEPTDDRHPVVRWVSQYVPFLAVLPTVTRRTFRQDLIAGLTVGVMVIPQSMSYANIAGLPHIYGMYAACLPTFVYALFGQSRQLAVGPVAMVSLLVEAGLNGAISEERCPEWYAAGGVDSGLQQYEVCTEEYVKLAILTSTVVGIMQILARILKLGFLVSFLGHPVTSGFTSGAAIIIGLSQLKYMLGFDVAKSQFIYETLWNILSNLGKTKPMTLMLGLAWLTFLIVNKKLSKQYKKLSMLGPVGPLVTCVVGIFLIWLVVPLREDFHVKHVGDIPSGFSPISLSAWRIADVPTVLPTALSACLIGYMESIAIGKNLAAQHGYEIEAGQELLALGISNLVGSMFSCYPVTGSFSRSAVNNATGAVTQVSGLVTATVMLATQLFLTPLFYYLPNFVLSAIVISSVIPLVAYGEAIKLYRVKKQDFVLWVVAFVGTLFLGVLMGIAIAVGLSLVIVIYESVRPQIMILWRIPGTTIYRNVKQESSGAFIPGVFIARIGSSMYFANASFIKDMLQAYVEDMSDVNEVEYIVLEMTPVVSLDSTAVHVIQDIVSDFRGRGIQIAFAMVGNRVDKTLEKAKLKEFIGPQWFFHTVHEAVVYSIRHQREKRRRNPENPDGEEVVRASTGDSDYGVLVGNEVGFSNDMHHECTTIFINLIADMPMIMSEITMAFRKGHISVSRAMVEPLGDTDASGAKHTYTVRSIHHGGKLLDWEISTLRKELEDILKRRQDDLEALPSSGWGGAAGEDARLQALEESNLRLKQQLADVSGDRAVVLVETAAADGAESRNSQSKCSV